MGLFDRCKKPQVQTSPEYQARDAEIQRQIAAEPRAHRIYLPEVFERSGGGKKKDAGATLLTGDFARLDAKYRAMEGNLEDRMRWLELIAWTIEDFTNVGRLQKLCERFTLHGSAES